MKVLQAEMQGTQAQMCAEAAHRKSHKHSRSRVAQDAQGASCARNRPLQAPPKSVKGRQDQLGNGLPVLEVRHAASGYVEREDWSNQAQQLRKVSVARSLPIGMTKVRPAAGMEVNRALARNRRCPSRHRRRSAVEPRPISASWSD